MNLRVIPALAALPLLVATVQAADIFAGITSNQPATAMSVSAERALSDGRLVLRIAVQNRTQAPFHFGPDNIRLAQASGEAVPLRPLSSLINDVRAAAGLPIDTGPSGGASVQESPAMPTTSTGQRDVSGYTGSMAAPSGPLRAPTRAKRPDPPEIQAQVAALKAGILGDGTIAPGEVMAGQVVSERIKFRRKRERTLDLSVAVGGDTHSFRFDAPD